MTLFDRQYMPTSSHQSAITVSIVLSCDTFVQGHARSSKLVPIERL